MGEITKLLKNYSVKIQKVINRKFQIPENYVNIRKVSNFGARVIIYLITLNFHA